TRSPPDVAPVGGSPKPTAVTRKPAAGRADPPAAPPPRALPRLCGAAPSAGAASIPAATIVAPSLMSLLILNILLARPPSLVAGRSSFVVTPDLRSRRGSHRRGRRRRKRATLRSAH